MTLVVKASELIGRPVVTITGGEDVAEVKDIVYRSEQGDLVGFTLNKRGFLSGSLREVLPVESVHAIGRDAVMIDNTEDCLVDPKDAPAAVAEPEKDRDVFDDAVVTESGVRLGRVRDVVLVVGGAGEVVGFELARDESNETWFIPRPAQLAVSGDALIVPDQLEEFIVDDLTGFGAAIDRYRDTLQRS
jgi:uncharacterized protein YrrD